MKTADALLLAEARSLARSGEARRLRERATLSQVEEAAVVGVVATTVSRWESGDRTPRGEAGIRYGRFLQRLAARFNSQESRDGVLD